MTDTIAVIPRLGRIYFRGQMGPCEWAGYDIQDGHRAPANLTDEQLTGLIAAVGGWTHKRPDSYWE